MKLDDAQPDSPTGDDAAPRAAHVKRHARVHFEQWARSYDRSRLNELVFYPSIRACLEEITLWLPEHGDAPFNMLDVGCGTGTLLALASRLRQAGQLVGLDYAEAMVRRAAEKFAGLDTPVRPHVVRGDAERLPFHDRTFDVVSCCNSFHHYPRQAEAVREFRRVLRPGGVLILIDGFRDNVIGWVVFDVGVAMVEGHVHHAAWSEIKRMVHDAGFANLRQRKKNVLAPLLINTATVG